MGCGERHHLLQHVLQRSLEAQHELVQQRDHITHVLAVSCDVHQDLQGCGEVGQHSVG